MQTVKLSWRILSHLDGTGLFQHERYSSDADTEAAAQRMRAKVESAPHRADKSVSVKLDELELEVVREYVDGLLASARCDAGWDADARADLNAARAFLRKYGAPDRSWMRALAASTGR